MSEQCGKDCPYSEWEFDDLLYSSLGNYVCELRTYYGEYGMPQGHPDCDSGCEDYTDCSVYKKQKSLEGKTEDGK